MTAKRKDITPKVLRQRGHAMELPDLTAKQETELHDIFARVRKVAGTRDPKEPITITVNGISFIGF